jgi:hypothetical protein
MTTSIKYMDLSEFQAQGWLLEANRLFFHPRGLALEITVNEEGFMALTGIWDSRNDPEGIVFDPGVFEPGDQAKSDAIEALRKSKVEKRFRAGCLGDGIQPIVVTPSPA